MVPDALELFLEELDRGHIGQRELERGPT